MKASIIIPSYNAEERLKLNLEALNLQDYEKDDIEVIVINNGSTDATGTMLQNIKLKFPLEIVTVEKNQGIANGRNQGIAKARGEILIFHDSDMIAAKDYLSRHLSYHKENNMVVCGVFWKRIYSFYYENFNQQQLADLSPAENKTQFITQAQIEDESFLEKAFDLQIDFIKNLKHTLNRYGKNLVHYTLPWRFCITNNLSVQRERVLDIGMFDDKIIKYGYEDYDLGLRLYKNGGKFVIAEDIISVHQEHPQNFTNADLIENTNYIFEKYNNIYFMDMLLVCLSDFLQIDDEKINQVMLDIDKILGHTEYHDVLTSFLSLMQGIQKIIFTKDYDYMKILWLDFSKMLPHRLELIRELKKKNTVNIFLEQYDDIVKKIFNVSVLSGR